MQTQRLGRDGCVDAGIAGLELMNLVGLTDLLSEPACPCVSIAQATTRDELEAIYRFRYQIYVEEMRRPQFDADHNTKRIEDRLDAWARNFYVADKNGVLAVIRGNIFRDGRDSEYEAMYQPHLVAADHPRRTCMVTRLMITKSVRGSDLVVKLFIWLYRYAMQHELRWIFLDCNDWLIPFFQRFGFVEHCEKHLHKEYGLVTPMRIDLLDRAHLESVDSPYLRIFDESNSKAHL